MNENKIYKKFADCPLTIEDELAFGKVQSEATRRLKEIEVELKDLKSEKIQIENRRSRAAEIINQGFENREIECRAVFNSPENGKVSYYPLGDVLLPLDKPVKIEKMTQEQMEI